MTAHRACRWRNALNWPYEAVKDVIVEHSRLGLALYIGSNGKVVKLSPSKVRSLSKATYRK